MVEYIIYVLANKCGKCAISEFETTISFVIEILFTINKSIKSPIAQRTMKKVIQTIDCVNNEYSFML